MSALESPLEALTFNYLSFGLFTVVNNIWAWVAVITAAFSFWRIKTSSTLPKPTTRGKLSGDASLSPPRTTFVPPSEKVESVSTSNEPSTTSPATTYTSLSTCVLDKEGGTKGKFTTYFEHDDVNHHNRVNKKGREEFKILSKWIQNDTFSSNYVGEWYESWEKVIKTIKGEMGWYNYQDSMVIDGNVVRLWESCRRRREAEATAFLGDVVKTW